MGQMVRAICGSISEILSFLVLKGLWKHMGISSSWKRNSRGPHIVEAMLHDLDACGLGAARIVTKTGQEPAIVDFQAKINKARREIQAEWSAEEKSRVVHSPSNGRMERAILEFAGLGRVMRVAMEEHTREHIKVAHPIVPAVSTRRMNQYEIYRAR